MATHISGLSGSGMDVDQLVKDAMKAQRARYDSLYKKKTQLEWKKTDYNDIYKAVNDFRTNTVFNYKLQSTLNPKKASTSNSDIVDITATADAASVNHSLTINNVAEGVNLISAGAITTAGREKTSLATQFGLDAGTQFNIRLTNGTESKEIAVNTSDSIYELVNNINNAGIHVQANYDANLDRLFLYTSNTGSNASLDFSGSSAKGFDFITKNLKIATPTAAVPQDSSITSTDSLGLKVPLASRFSDLTSPFELKIHDATTNVDQLISINPSTDSLQTLMAKISDTSVTPNAQALLDYDQTTGSLKISSTVGHSLQLSSSNTGFLTDMGLPADIPNTGAVGTVNLGMAGTDTLAKLGLTEDITININGKSIAVKTTDTINDLMANINTQVAGIASYDDVADKLSLNANGVALDFSGNDSKALSFLTGTLDLPVLQTPKGEDADITLDGVNFKESKNIFTIAGLTYTLKGESPKNTDNSVTPVNVSVTNDIDKLVANVQSFVDAYNKLLDKVNTEADETKYKDYLPLTTDEKAAMKDSDITLWEQKAKSGMLHNDSILENLSYNLRNELSNPIAGLTSKYNSASSIGITTGDYSEKGKLYLNQTALRDALEADPDAVNNIFGAKSDDTSKQGIAVKMYDLLKVASDQIVTTAGATANTDYDTQSIVAKEITDYTTRMSDLSTRLKDMEERYYKQFDAMEQALASMNKQSSWLSQQFSG